MMAEDRPTGPGPIGEKWATAIVLVCLTLALAIALLVGLAARDGIERVQQRVSKWIAAQEKVARSNPTPAKVEEKASSYPPPASRFGQSMLVESDWITADDYPPSSIRAGEQGRVAIRWQVNAAGKVERCIVEASSGYPALDRAACSAIVRRGHYPALAPGSPTRIFHRRVVWVLPEDA